MGNGVSREHFSGAGLEVNEHAIEGLDHDAGRLELRAVPGSEGPLPLASEGEHRDLRLEDGHVLAEAQPRPRVERRHLVLVHLLDLDLPTVFDPPPLRLEDVSIRPEDFGVAVEQVRAVVHKGVGRDLVASGGHGVLIDAHLLLSGHGGEAPPHLVEEGLAHGNVVHVPERQRLVNVLAEDVAGLVGKPLLPLQTRLVLAQKVGQGGQGGTSGVTTAQEEGQHEVPQVSAGVGLPLLAAVDNEEGEHSAVTADRRGDAVGAVGAEVFVDHGVDVLVQDLQVSRQLPLHTQAQGARELPRGEKVTLNGQVLHGVEGALELQVLRDAPHGVDGAVEGNTVGGVECVAVPHGVHVNSTSPGFVHQHLVHLLRVLSEDERHLVTERTNVEHGAQYLPLLLPHLTVGAEDAGRNPQELLHLLHLPRVLLVVPEVLLQDVLDLLGVGHHVDRVPAVRTRAGETERLEVVLPGDAEEELVKRDVLVPGHMHVHVVHELQHALLRHGHALRGVGDPPAGPPGPGQEDREGDVHSLHFFCSFSLRRLKTLLVPLLIGSQAPKKVQKQI
eukprot:Hpha_TRINITY_DN16403_c0_g2::TRINITY_DN16403_c0_g2_i1::g.159170::m.159170